MKKNSLIILVSVVCLTFLLVLASAEVFSIKKDKVSYEKYKEKEKLANLEQTGMFFLGFEKTSLKNPAKTKNVSGAICYDTDGGIEPYVFGTVVYIDQWQNSTYSDYCLDTKNVTEYYCDGDDNVAWEIYPCIVGCSMGACIDFAIAGDLNCDGFTNELDVDPFVLAMSSALEYQLQFPGCDITNADINQDGLINFDDIDGFLEIIFSNQPIKN